MKDTMRNMMKRNTLSILLIALLALGAMQASAVNYQTKYKGTRYNVQSTASFGVAAPAATFRSTSAFSSPEWAEQPMLNSDATVNEGAYMSGPRRLGEGPSPGGTQPGTPGNPKDENQQPLGDALIPLALLACAYAIYKVSRRRKEA